MAVKITIGEGGEIEAEFASILEDLHHDYLHFKQEATRLAGSAKDTPEWFIAKRFERAALLTLMAYLEGVVNSWLEAELSADQWAAMEKKSLHEKCERLTRRVPPKQRSTPNTKSAKDLRNDIAHLKAGSDLRIYSGVTLDLLTKTEQSIETWLRLLERTLGRKRHPNTKAESDRFFFERRIHLTERGEFQVSCIASDPDLPFSSRRPID